MQTQLKPTDRSIELRRTAPRTAADRQHQKALERMLAERAAAAFSRAQRFNLAPQSRRHDTRANLIEWQAQAESTRYLRQLPLPPAPGEDNAPPLVGRRAQNVILLLVAVATVVVIAARVGGVL